MAKTRNWLFPSIFVLAALLPVMVMVEVTEGSELLSVIV
jgi:hypothetical protein